MAYAEWLEIWWIGPHHCGLKPVLRLLMEWWLNPRHDDVSSSRILRGGSWNLKIPHSALPIEWSTARVGETVIMALIGRPIVDDRTG